MSAVTPALAVEAKPKEPPYKPQTRLVAAYFVNSVLFSGEQMSVSLGRNADSITPGRLEGDGSVVAVGANQRADGLVIKMKRSNLNTRERYVAQAFVPFANVRSVEYGE